MAMSKKDFIALADAIREHNRVAIGKMHNGDLSMRPRWIDYLDGKVGKNGGKVAA